MAKSFYQLNIWKKGLELLLYVYKVTSKYPGEEKFNLITQTRGSANSVLANIAEAHGRYYFADKIRVLYQSRGEVEETRSHLMVAYHLEYLSKEDFEYLDKEYEGLAKGISSYIGSIEEQKN